MSTRGSAPESPNDRSIEEALDEVISSYLEALEAGEAPSRAELLEQNPGLARRLEQFFADYDGFGQVAGTANGHSVPDPSKVPRRFGDYQILAEIARGGMGLVFKEQQVSLNRPVALKMILAGRLASEREVERFRLEAEMAAGLDHPNIVSIHEVGEHEGQHFFSMQLIEGRSLLEHLPGLTRAPREAARLAEKIAAAVHYAHQRGVLHRDLKPANVLLDPSGEPHITDFGLAKTLRSDSSLTLSGTIVGTPSYVAPELVDGKGSQATVACDVYGLGALLYECLTGRPPFQGLTPLETLEQVRRNAPQPPRARNRGVDRDLETICLRCLEKEPRRRYPSAGALADDLRRYLQGRPIEARPAGPWERAVKWAKRRPAAAALIGISCAALLTLLVVALWYNARLQRALEESEKRRALARRHLSTADMNLAVNAWSESKLDRMKALLERHLPAPGEEDLRSFGWRYLWRLSQLELPPLRDGPGGPQARESCGVAFHPDGRLLASGHGSAVKLWDRGTGGWLATLEGHTLSLRALAFSLDGKILVTASGFPDSPEPGEIKLWDPQARKHLQDLPGHGGCVSSLAFSPAGEVLASGSLDGTVRLWEAATGGLRAVLDAGGRVWSVAFVPGGRQLAAATGPVPLGDGSIPGQAVLWDLLTRKELLTLRGHRSDVQSVAFSPEGKLLATGSMDHTVKLWDPANGQEITTLSGHTGAVTFVGFSPDGRLLLTTDGGSPATWKLWHLESTLSGKLLAAHWSHAGGFQGAAISPDGRTLATSSKGSPQLWDLKVLEASLPLLFSHGLRCAAFSPDGRTVAIGDSGGALTLVDRETRKKTLVPEREGSALSALAFAPDGRTLAAGSKAGSVGLLDIPGRKFLGRLKGHRGSVRTLAFHPSGKTLAVASYRKVKVWEAVTWESLAEYPAHDDRVYALLFSSDGRTLFTGSRDGTVKLWDFSRWSEYRRLPTGGAQVWALALSVDETVLAAGCQDHRVLLWDARTGSPVGALGGHTGAVTSLTFTPDGKELVSGGADATLKLWDAVTWQERASLEAQGAVYAVAISRDGKTLASAADSASALQLWEAAAPEEAVELSGAAVPARYRSPPAPEASAPEPGSKGDPGWSEVTSADLAGEGGCQGVAAGDYDGDRDLDLYLLFYGPNRLLRNDGQGGFREATPPLLADTGDGQGAAFGDYDGDGDLDLYLANADSANRLFRNQGGGVFSDATTALLAGEGKSQEVAWVDCDGDGDLDLYVASSSQASKLLRNDGGGQFADATPEPLRDGIHAAWGDADGDGDLDVFLCRAKYQAALLKNLGEGSFAEATPSHFAGRPLRQGSWGDYDGDGDLDLFVCSRYLVRDTLYRQESGGDLVPATLRLSGRPGYSADAHWVDYDLDGDLDLFVADNDGESRLWSGDGRGAFKEATGGPLRGLGSLSCVTWQDFDGDGDLDLFAADWDKRNWLLRNDNVQGRHWLQVELEGRPSNTQGIGARVRLVAGGRAQIRDLASSSRSAVSLACFGLGQEEKIEILEVRWPSGATQTLRTVPVDTRLTVREVEARAEKRAP